MLPWILLGKVLHGISVHLQASLWELRNTHKLHTMVLSIGWEFGWKLKKWMYLSYLDASKGSQIMSPHQANMRSYSKQMTLSRAFTIRLVSPTSALWVHMCVCERLRLYCVSREKDEPLNSLLWRPGVLLRRRAWITRISVGYLMVSEIQ